MKLFLIILFSRFCATFFRCTLIFRGFCMYLYVCDVDAERIAVHPRQNITWPFHSVLSPSKCNRQEQHKGRITVQTAAACAFVSVQENTSTDTRAPFSAARTTTPTSSILPGCKCGDACHTANAILFVYPERWLRSLWGRCKGEKRGEGEGVGPAIKDPQTPQMGFQSVLICSSP